MVRLKQRYILFEILYPLPTREIDYQLTGKLAITDLAERPSRALTSLHKESPASINPKTITNTIRQIVQEYYGDYGSSFSLQLNLKYFNNKTSSGILRCGVQNFQYVLAALTLINQIGGKEVIVNCKHVSGTIKKCEDFAIMKNIELIRSIEFYQKLENGSLNEI